MKSSLTLLILAGIAFVSIAGNHSRAQTAATNLTPQQSLQALKEKNQKLIEAQAATLQKLDEITKNAQQLRAFSKRS